MPYDWFEQTMKLLVVVTTGGGIWLAFRAVMGRLRGGRARERDSAELGQLRESVQRLTGEVAELQERVDFAERLLAQQHQAGRIGSE
jgi:hypothetical protein